ncbi:hypothetical protein OC835_007211, partial [Tilletia horrida]
MRAKALLSTAILAALFGSASPAAIAIPDQPSKLDVGAACDTDAQCSTTYCSFTFPLGGLYNDRTKVCRKMPATGPCTSSDQCATGNCDQATGTCAFDPRPNGQCEQNIDCLSGLCSDVQQCADPPHTPCDPLNSNCGVAYCDDTYISAYLDPYCSLLPDGARCWASWQCQSGQCGDNPRGLQCGLSLQADGTLLRAERCFEAKFCIPSTIGSACSSNGDCGDLYCNANTGRCGLAPVRSHGPGPALCDSHMYGMEPYGRRRLDSQCAALPAGSPCTHDGMCGSESCNLASGT